MSEGRVHTYALEIRWTGNLGAGTASYREYSRDHEVAAPGKPPLPGSSDPDFRGDPARYNPEELLVASLSACHMLWYLHLCADAGIVVTGYFDRAWGRMREGVDGGGRFEEVVLKPEIHLASGSDLALAERLHEGAHERCYIASSVNFPVQCLPATIVGPVGDASRKTGGTAGADGAP